MKTVTVLALSTVIAASVSFAGEELSNVHSVPGPNKVLYDYLGDPVATPPNMDAAYTKEGLTRAIQDAAKAAGISLTKLEIDDSEFPFLVGVIYANEGDVDTSNGSSQKLTEQIRKMAAYNYTGGVGAHNAYVMNLVPNTAFPTDARQRIFHRLMLREAVLYDKIQEKQ